LQTPHRALALRHSQGRCATPALDTLNISRYSPFYLALCVLFTSTTSVSALPSKLHLIASFAGYSTLDNPLASSTFRATSAVALEHWWIELDVRLHIIRARATEEARFARSKQQAFSGRT
jgi:hypothetical protein